MLEKETFDIEIGHGSGTLYGSCEETDFLLRLYRIKANLFKYKSVRVFHPTQYPSPRKAYLYGLGRFWLIKKHNLEMFYYLINLLQPLIRLFISADLKRINTYIASILGKSGIEILLYNRPIKK